MSTYVLTDLGSLGRGGTEASNINDTGQVVGTTYDSTGIHRAFLWMNGTMIDLGTLGDGPSSAAGINDLGQVVGTAYTVEGVPVPYLLTPEDTNGDGRADRWFRDLDGDGANDLMTHLATADYSRAMDINDAAQVVGSVGSPCW